MNSKTDFSLLKTLAELPGVAGREEAVRAEINRTLDGLGIASHTDALGNLLAFVPGSSKQTVILCAHMDEVGLMVNYVSPDGFLYFVPVGGIDPRTLLAQRVAVHTRSGALTGIIGTKPAHITSEAERGKAVPMSELFIDIGLSGDEARAQVHPGDFVTLERPFVQFGNGRVSVKALDDRVGCFCLLEAARRVQRPAVNVHLVFSAQEEVGLRGAGTAAFGLEADFALAVDATGAADIPLCRPQDYLVRLGGGAAVSAMDACTITPQWLLDALTDLCTKRDITYQVRIAPRGGNDAGAIHRSRTGIASCALSVPVRNIHSNVETASMQDIENTIDLLCAVLEGGVKLPGEGR